MAWRVLSSAGFNRIGGEEGWRLRAAVWEEDAAAPAVICAHVVVTNLDMENPLLFTFELGGRAPPPSVTDVDGTMKMLTAKRIFGPGKVTGNLTSTDGSAWAPVQAWLAPSETGIFRIGCDAAKPPAANSTNIAKADVESPALWRSGPGGWAKPAYGGVDAGTRISSDATVAAEGRHSTKIQLPSAKPLVMPFPGKQLVPPPPLVHYGAKKNALFCDPFYSYQNHQFTKTGSGQT